LFAPPRTSPPRADHVDAVDDAAPLVTEVRGEGMVLMERLPPPLSPPAAIAAAARRHVRPLNRSGSLAWWRW
jgi:hypothetical protein